MRHFLTNPLRIFFVGLFLFSIIIWTTSCHYFKVRTYTPNSEAFSLETVEEMGWHFFIHNAESTYSILNIKADSVKISGFAIASPEPSRDSKEEKSYYSNKKIPLYSKDRPKRYKKNTENTIVHEVHFYLKDDVVLNLAETDYVEIPATDIEEVRIIDPNTGATIASYVFSTIGLIVGFLAIILIIVLLTKSSCPFVYADNGETFIFEGEIYGGAIMHNMERADYLPLPNLKVKNGQYRIRISNELKEKQIPTLHTY